MMLVACKECGVKIAESALVCPKCGVSNPAGTCQLNIYRKRAMTGAISTVEIYIDGQIGGRVKNGETITFDLVSGEHEVTAVCTNPAPPAITRRGTFEVHVGQTAEFECGFSMVSGFYFKRT